MDKVNNIVYKIEASNSQSTYTINVQTWTYRYLAVLFLLVHAFNICILVLNDNSINYRTQYCHFIPVFAHEMNGLLEKKTSDYKGCIE